MGTSACDTGGSFTQPCRGHRVAIRGVTRPENGIRANMCVCIGPHRLWNLAQHVGRRAYPST